MAKGIKKAGSGTVAFILKIWGIRHVCAIFYLLWLFLWWYRFDRDTRLSINQGEIDKFYDIWFGRKASPSESP
jgi:hypothetical protein